VYNSLILTSSLDWSIKVWSIEASTEPILEINSPSFDSIIDVKWSPLNPSVFAAITSRGALQIWDLSHSTTAPKDTIHFTEESGHEGVINMTAQFTVHKVNWSHDGKYLMVGDSRGVVHVVSTKEI
jgi:dynein intermediate chain, cytosolic